MPVSELNKKCCGCGACADICPRKAITMVEDEETFVYPHVDSSLCVECGLCEKTCPLNFDGFKSINGSQAFVGIYKDKDVAFNSSSGGAFTALYELYLSKGYTVCGAEYADHLQVTHGFADTADGCSRFRKSKYVQSSTVGCFSDIAERIKNGQKVLFSGVSCQCAALRGYLKALNVQTENLVTVNTLCHGVPSQKMFDSFIAEQETKEGSSIVSFTFRNKRLRKNAKRVNSRTVYTEYANGKIRITDNSSDAFLRGYYEKLFYRPSCGTCPFAREERISDYTISDAWFSDRLYPEFDPYEGVSMILFNTSQAFASLNAIKEEMDLKEVPIDWVINSQGLFRQPTTMHKNREMFFEMWSECGFEKAVLKCTKPTLKKRIVSLFPVKLKVFFKKLLR